MVKTKDKKTSKVDAERARKEAWLARSRSQPGSSVGDLPVDTRDGQRPNLGQRIGDA
jgi:hypothetical protein